MEEHSARLRRFYDAEMQDRAGRPLGAERERIADDFGQLLQIEQRSRLLEVGCGAGRDALRLAGSGTAYTGVDLSAAAVGICRDLGLVAVEASATALPFTDDTFDAPWSMSTLMHLAGDRMPSCCVRSGRWGGWRRSRPGTVGMTVATTSGHGSAPDHHRRRTAATCAVRSRSSTSTT